MVKVKVLVVDDEPAIRKLLERGLTGYGHTVFLTSSGDQAILATMQQAPDIILLDIGLQGETDGIEVCRQLREWSTTPVIMLTVHDEKQMKLAALDAGADDYVTKPFDMEELAARLRAVLRRSAYEGAKSASGEIRIDDLAIDLVNRRVLLSGHEVHLTPREYDLLKVLAINPGRVLTFRTLFAEICGRVSSAKPEHNVRVLVNTLRKKLKDDPSTTIKPRFIISVPSIGYRFADRSS